MQKYLYITLAAVILSLTACEDMLKMEPEGSTKTAGQVSDANLRNPETTVGSIAGIWATMIKLWVGLGKDYESHIDFGYASVCAILESSGQDYIGTNSGYDWYSPDSDFSNRVYTHESPKIIWTIFYKMINASNSVIEAMGDIKDITDPETMGNLGQAYAARGFAYMNLAQCFQYTYKPENLNLPCVPIVREKMTMAEITNNPRATVAQVYDLIMSDLDNAVTLTADYSRPSKAYVSQAVAYGLRARANLLMKNYSAAAADAEMALNLSGAQPYSMEDVSKPNFTSAGASSVLWANIINESNDIVETSIINWPSHLCTFFTDGYTGVGAYRSISQLLYDKIDRSDVRKGWWLNEKGNSALLNVHPYDFFKANTGAGMAYVNVKFGLDDDNAATMIPAQDWILMRAEELILLRAEALACSGNTADALNTLQTFVKTYRNPKYSFSNASVDALVDEIWLQRRIELWGEGFAYYDIMRLEKPVTRILNGKSNYPAAWQYNLEANAPIMLWPIPSAEIEANDGISMADNNPQVTPPTAVL